MSYRPSSLASVRFAYQGNDCSNIDHRYYCTNLIICHNQFFCEPNIAEWPQSICPLLTCISCPVCPLILWGKLCWDNLHDVIVFSDLTEYLQIQNRHNRIVCTGWVALVVTLSLIEYHRLQNTNSNICTLLSRLHAKVRLGQMFSLEDGMCVGLLSGTW